MANATNSRKVSNTNKDSDAKTRKDSKKGYRNNNYRGRPRDAKESKSANTTSGNAITRIINTAGSIAVRNIGGNPVPIPVKTSQGFNQGTYDYGNVIPGVVSVGYAPVFGTATGKMTDPVNLAARNIWMNLRSLYSNMIPYSGGFIIFYAMALDSILMFYQFLKRAYGIVFAYDARNKYVPDALLASMDIDPADFRANLPDVKVTLNKVATQLTAFGVPTELRFILDHVDATAHIYMDDTSPTAQYIVPSPSFLWKMNWAENKLVQVLNLSCKQSSWLDTGYRTWSALKATLNDLVESFVNYEDVYKIAGDMLRLYGSLSAVSPLDDDYAVGPEFDPDWLEEIHNATLAKTQNMDTLNWEVTEIQSASNVGAISCNYSTGYDFGAVCKDAILMALPGVYDFKAAEPTIDQMIRTTNWKFFGEKLVAKIGDHKLKIDSCGTMFIHKLSLFKFRYVGNSVTIQSCDIMPKVALGTEGSGNCVFVTPYNAMDLLFELWNSHPIVPYANAYEHTISSSSSDYMVVPMLPGGAIDQLVTIDPDEITRIHEAIILDKFDAAGVGLINLTPKTK